MNRALRIFGAADGCLEETLRAWYHGLKRAEVDPVKRAIRLFGKAYPDAVFIQIGANDGMALDPLRAEVVCRRWRGVMIEPVPYVFKRLHQRYGKHPRIKLVNAAIADRDGSLPFYALAEQKPGEEVWHWYHALGSFRKDVLLKHKYLIPDIEDRILEIQVGSLTFESLCRQTGITQLDLLQMDTEGYDYEIIRRVPFDKFRPKLILYEYQHLCAEDRTACRSLLHEQGYISFESGIDTVALDKTRIGASDKPLENLFLSMSDTGRTAGGV
ncbi:MAG: FkbM family methyltransferase [Stenotrophobium sp.]